MHSWRVASQALSIDWGCAEGWSAADAGDVEVNVKRPKPPSAAAVQMHAWCRAVHGHILDAAAAEGEPLQFMKGMDDDLDRALASGDERGLRMVAGDLREWAGGLPRSTFEAIDKDLVARFGIGLVDKERAFKKDVLKILRRRSIGDDDEYRALKAWLDDAAPGDVRRTDVESVRTLLAEYEAKHWNAR